MLAKPLIHACSMVISRSFSSRLLQTKAEAVIPSSARSPATLFVSSICSGSEAFQVKMVKYHQPYRLHTLSFQQRFPEGRFRASNGFANPWMLAPIIPSVSQFQLNRGPCVFASPFPLVGFSPLPQWLASPSPFPTADLNILNQNTFQAPF